MRNHMNALYCIASQLEQVDPLAAYELSNHLRVLTAADRRFKLQLTGREKKLSHPDDQIELVENRGGGWDWIHTNVDGHGTRNMTGWRLQPSEVLKMIEQSIESGPMVEEVKAMLNQEMAAGNAGVPRGAEMGGGPSALPEVPMNEIPSAVVMPEDRTWMRDTSIHDPTLGAETVKLVRKAIAAAKINPALRPRILPILSKLLNA
jgi:hypothetical protein